MCVLDVHVMCFVVRFLPERLLLIWVCLSKIVACLSLFLYHVFLVSCFTLLVLFLSFLLFTCYVKKSPAFQWRTFMCKNISTYVQHILVHALNILTGFILVLYKHVYQSLLLVCYFH